MSDLEIQFLDACQPEAIEAFRRLLVQMERAGATRLLLTDGPDCDFILGVADTNGDDDAIDHSMEFINDFGERWDAMCPPDDDDSYIDTDTRWAWLHTCWLAAGGRESGRIVVLFANGLGDMMDLNTGAEPDASLGFP